MNLESILRFPVVNNSVSWNFVMLKSPWTKIEKIWDRNKIPPKDVLQSLVDKICKWFKTFSKKIFRMAQSSEQSRHMTLTFFIGQVTVNIAENGWFSTLLLAPFPVFLWRWLMIIFIFSGMYLVHYHALPTFVRAARMKRTPSLMKTSL